MASHLDRKLESSSKLGSKMRLAASPFLDISKAMSQKSEKQKNKSPPKATENQYMNSIITQAG